MKNYMRYICLAVMAVMSVQMWGTGSYPVTIHQNLTGLTERSGNATTFQSDRNTELTLYYNITSGYDAVDAYYSASGGNITFSNGSTTYDLTGKVDWVKESEGVYKLRIYFNNNISISSSDFYITITLEKTCSTQLATPTGLSATPTVSGATLSWNSVTNATSYHIVLTDANDLLYEYDVTGTSKTVTGLPSSTAFIWTVQAIGSDDYCDSEQSTTADFSTLAPQEYTVSFSVANGTTPTSIKRSMITLPEIPNVCDAAAEEGWSPYGWAESSVADNSNAANIIGVAGEDYSPESNCTLYAVYKKGGNTITSTSFSKVTTISSLVTSGTFVLTQMNSAASAISNTVNGSYVKQAAVTISSSTLTTTNASVLWQVWEVSGSPKYYQFENVVTGKYLATNGTGKATLSSTQNDATKWTVETSTNGYYFKNKATSEYLYYGENGWKTHSTKNGSNDHIYAYYNSNETFTIASVYQSSLNCTQYYHVIYEDNGADEGEVPVDGTPHESGTSITVLDNTGNLAKTGYTFSCWNTQANGGGKDYAEGSSFNISQDMTLYAKWTVKSYNVAVELKNNITQKATPASGSDIAEDGNANVDFGKTITLNYKDLTPSATFVRWKITKQTDGEDVTAELLSETNANDATFTMPDYAVNISSVLMSGLRTSCNAIVTYQYAGGTHIEKVALNGNPAGYTAEDCVNKRFMGWTMSDMGNTLTQTAPIMTDPKSVKVDNDIDFYAVYASPNGGKVTGVKESHLDSIHTLTTTYGWQGNVKVFEEGYATYTLSESAYRDNMPKVTSGENVSVFKLDASQVDAHITTSKVRDLSAITFSYRTNGLAIPYYVKYSTDNSNWIKLTNDGVTLKSAQDKVSAITVELPAVDDYYIQIGVTYHNGSGTTKYAGIMGITYTTQSRSVWYSDYSNGCDVAESAKLTFNDSEDFHEATAVPERYEVVAPTKAGYTFDHFTVEGEDYREGDVYLLAHDVEAVCTWKENPTITGDLYVTSAFLAADGTKAARTVQASMTLTATTTESKTGTLTIADAIGTEGGKFHAEITDATVDDDALNATIKIQYTPSQADVEETATMTATIDGCSTEFTVYGRSLPEEFVIAAKCGNSWYALPADMSNANTYAGAMITVDDPANPQKALLARTGTKYAMYEGSGAVDHVRFAATESANKETLWASDANTHIRNWAKIDGGSATTNLYNWTMTTTDNTNYVLHSLARNDYDLRLNTSATWGVYDKLGTNSLRFLPVEETIEQAPSMTIEEWYPTKILVKTEDAIASAQVSIQNSAFADATVTSKGTHYYEIVTGTLTGAEQASNTLAIKYTTTALNTYLAMAEIPVIISNETTTVSTNSVLRTLMKGVYNNSTLIVRDGAVLTIDGTNYNDNQFADVWIYPTAKISVPSGKRLTVRSLNLLGGIDEIYNGSTYTTKKYEVPEFSLKGDLYNNSDAFTKATYYMRTDANQMYLYGVPCQVNFSDIKYADGTNAGAGTAFYGEAYNGSRRATGKVSGNWIYEEDFTETRFDRGTGYWFAAETKDGENYALMQMPLTISEGGDQTVEVSYFGSDANVAAVHKGWNFISNPYMTTIQPTHLVVNDGTEHDYDYVIIPDEEHYTQSFYDQYYVADGVLKPFKSFFVQVAHTGTLTFASSDRQSAPVRREAWEEEQPEVFYAVKLNGGTSKEGSFGMRISDQYTDEYEIGKDLEFMTPAGHGAYTLTNGIRLKYNAINKYFAQVAIPVGFTAREAGEYTFTLKSYINGQDLDHVWLTDYEQGVTVDLTEGDYTFTTTVQTNNETRFAVATVLKEHQMPSDTEEVESDDGDSPNKFIYRDMLYIRHNGVIYDATGKKVLTNKGGRK